MEIESAIRLRLAAIEKSLIDSGTTMPVEAQRALCEDRWALYESDESGEIAP